MPVSMFDLLLFFLQELIEDFLFPTARVLLKMVNQRQNAPTSVGSSSGSVGHGSYGGVAGSTSSNNLFDAAYSDPLALLDMPSWARPICQTPASINAAFEVISSLCYASPENLNALNETLTLLFYSENESPITGKTVEKYHYSASDHKQLETD